MQHHQKQKRKGGELAELRSDCTQVWLVVLRKVKLKNQELTQQVQPSYVCLQHKTLSVVATRGRHGGKLRWAFFWRGVWVGVWAGFRAGLVPATIHIYGKYTVVNHIYIYIYTHIVLDCIVFLFFFASSLWLTIELKGLLWFVEILHEFILFAVCFGVFGPTDKGW